MALMNIAHRGYSSKYPENTMLAFRRAVEAGAEGIEFDVHLSRDGELVIIHDEWLERTTGVKGFVKDFDLSELRRIDASRGFESLPGPNPIPTLEEYFELIDGVDILTNIELKTGVFWYPDIEAKVLAVIDRFGRRKDVIISSFNHFSVLKMKELAPDMVCGFLEESRIIAPAEYCRRYGAECWHPLCYDMTEDVVAELKAAGVRINAWTVNTRDEMEDMVRKGVDGVITNYPELFQEVRAKLTGQPWTPKPQR